MADYPYLVQRMYRYNEPYERRDGIDRHFGMDYMGSAEFEFGQLPHSLKAMRSAKDDLIGPRRIKVERNGKHYVVWYIGREDEYETAEKFFRDQLAPSVEQRGWRLKERTDISVELGTETHSSWSGRAIKPRGIDGWWALDTTWENPEGSRGYMSRSLYDGSTVYPWAFFKQKEDAKLFLKLIKEK